MQKGRGRLFPDFDGSPLAISQVPSALDCCRRTIHSDFKAETAIDNFLMNNKYKNNINRFNRMSSKIASCTQIMDFKRFKSSTGLIFT